MTKTQERLGRYRIVEELGHGSFGRVYLAENTELDNRLEALKVLYPQQLVDPDTVKLFHREVGTTAKLDHPHIVKVYDAGDIGGTRFMAMQYVPGRSLHHAIKKEGPQSLERVAGWLEQIGDALDYAHGEGVLHRDIKPSNILLDREGRAIVTDFGLAKAVEVSGGSMSSRDKEIMTGTVKYMAPEQAKGRPVPQSDIYSLGVVLYELLTGKVPFEGDDPFSIAFLHVSEEPVPLRRHHPDLPEPVEAVVLKAMAKAPEDRYQSGEAFSEAFMQAIRQPQQGAEASVGPEDDLQQARLAQLYEQGRQHLAAEQWEAAERAFGRVLAEAPGFRDAAILLEKARHNLSLSELYARVRGAFALQQWARVVRLGEELLGKSPGYKDTASLVEQAQEASQLLREQAPMVLQPQAVNVTAIRMDQRRRLNTAVILEIVAAFFGFFGIGWLYVGRTRTGIGLLLGYWALIAASLLLTAGLSFLCVIPVNFFAAIVSGLVLRSKLREQYGLR